MKKKIQLSLLGAVLTISAHAQNQYTLKSINVSASQGTMLKKKDVTDSVIIITKDELEESHVSTLNEALNKLANLNMTQNGGRGTASSFYIRGMSSKRILVLIDGVRYNNPTAIGASAEFSQIMLENVKRIEIIKGAESGVWGSDASGGVINIITSGAKKGLHGSAGVEYGSYNSAKTSLHASYGTKKFDITADTLFYTTDGFSAVEPVRGSANYTKRYDDLGLEKDPYINRTNMLKAGYNFTQNDKLEASVNIIKSIVHYDASSYNATTKSYVPADSTIPQTTVFNRFYHVGFTHKDKTNNIKVAYNTSIFNRDIVGTYGLYNYSGNVNEFKAEDKITYMKDSFIRVGASYQKFEQKDVTVGKDRDYCSISAFITNYNKLNLLANNNTIITESIRYDDYSTFDNSLTGKLGVKQFIKDDFYLSLNAGTGYNAPTLGQLYGKFGANPNLNPEKSLTTDITLGNNSVWITGFYNEIKDLIKYDYTLGYVQTSGKSKFKGIELGYQDFFGDALGVKALYTYLRTEDAQGKTLARRPINQLDASATYYLSDDFDIGGNVEYIGTRYDKAGDKGAQTGCYAIAGLVTNIKVNKKVKFYAKIDNLTDKYYQTVDGYATAGRSLYIGFVAKY